MTQKHRDGQQQLREDNAWSEKEGNDSLRACWGPDAALSSSLLLLKGLAPPTMGPDPLREGQEAIMGQKQQDSVSLQGVFLL